MLPEQKDLVYKHFPQLVQESDLEQVLEIFIKDGKLNHEFLDELSLEQDKAHNNRRILFRLLNLEKFNAFPGLVDGLRKTGSAHLADSLENKLETITQITNLHPLDVQLKVKFSSQFYDTTDYNRTSFYTTRSKNRGYVLIINNINFTQAYDERHGAEADERNLRELFKTMGFTVFSYTDLSAYDMYFKTQEFSQITPETPPDMSIVIIMSHGLVINNETMIVSSDNKFVAEESFKEIFNNEKCALFRKKPKIFIYHICRNVLREAVTRETLTDAILTNSERTYSDMLICHPSVKGFSAHRNSIKGSWYIQLLCKVFMEHAYDMDFESLLRKVDEELEVVSSLPWQTEDVNKGTQQTSTFKNIAFKRCYIHPGLYEEDGKMMKFNQNQ